MENNGFRIDAQRDMRAIMKLIENYIVNTYVKEIEQEMFRCRKKCEGTPSREIELFHALMPYIPKEKQLRCEDIVRLLQYEQVFTEMMPKLMKSESHYRRSEQDNVKLILMKVLLYTVISQKEK